MIALRDILTELIRKVAPQANAELTDRMAKEFTGVVLLQLLSIVCDRLAPMERRTLFEKLEHDDFDGVFSALQRIWPDPTAFRRAIEQAVRPLFDDYVKKVLVPAKSAI